MGSLCSEHILPDREKVKNNVVLSRINFCSSVNSVCVGVYAISYQRHTAVSILEVELHALEAFEYFGVHSHEKSLCATNAELLIFVVQSV